MAFLDRGGTYRTMTSLRALERKRGACCSSLANSTAMAHGVSEEESKTILVTWARVATFGSCQDLRGEVGYFGRHALEAAVDTSY